MQEVIDIVDGNLSYHPSFLGQQESDELLAYCLSSLDWQQPEIMMFGKKVRVPRLQAWMGDPQASYKYSGTQFSPLPWLPKIQSINDRLCAVTGAAFNSVLINLYRNGHDAMGWHRDNEKELGQNPVIASLSVGHERTFDLMHTKTKQKVSLSPEHGSLIIMSGELQTHWKHRIKRETKVKEPRVNLTFRTIHY